MNTNTKPDTPVLCISKPKRDYFGLLTLPCPTCGHETNVRLDETLRHQELVIIKHDACEHVSYFFLKPQTSWQ